ncbi:TPA: hypothetical protein QDB52_000541 [Burkholderia vietnamiensis]|nr:hypothetical protein [Burkholderia vietnamiensis]
MPELPPPDVPDEPPPDVPDVPDVPEVLGLIDGVTGPSTDPQPYSVTTDKAASATVVFLK